MANTLLQGSLGWGREQGTEAKTELGMDTAQAEGPERTSQSTPLPSLHLLQQVVCSLQRGPSKPLLPSKPTPCLCTQSQQHPLPSPPPTLPPCRVLSPERICDCLAVASTHHDPLWEFKHLWNSEYPSPFMGGMGPGGVRDPGNVLGSPCYPQSDMRCHHILPPTPRAGSDHWHREAHAGTEGHTNSGES